MKKIISKALGLLLSASFVVGAAVPLAACKKSPAQQGGLSTQANVTVINGTGGGTFNEGDTCTVTATVPEGSKFVEWTVFGVPVSTDISYSFKVDFDIELTAVYEAVAKTQYTITANGGTVGDTGLSTAFVNEGEKVSIHAAESQARKFVKWIIGDEESTKNPYELTVTGNKEITAVFDEFCMVSVSGGTVGGERSKIVPQGSDVTVKANDAIVGQQFVYWYTLDEKFSEVKVSEDTEYTFTLDTSTKIYAKFKHTFNVETVNGTVGDTGESSAYVLDGERITVQPDSAPSVDKAFIGWYENGKKVSVSKNYAFNVTKNIQLEAKYGELRNTPIDKPDSSGNSSHQTNGIIYREPGGAVAFDRLSSANDVTMFVEGAEYAAYKIYTSRTANKETDAVGELRLVLNPNPSSDKSDTAWLMSEDGERSMVIRGGLGNMYFDSPDFGKFQDLIRYTLGYEYCSGQTYYFAAQVKAPEDPYITMEDDFAIGYTDSEISEIGSWGYCETPGAPVGQYTVNIENGFIDGTLTQVVAGHGVRITAVATEPEDDGETEWIFLGWKEVTTDDGGNEKLGATLSSELNYTFTASKNITVRAVFADRSTIKQIPLPMPNNAENKLIYEEGAKGSSPIALDRNNFIDPEHTDSGSSMFNSNVAYVNFFVYESPSAEKTDYIASFRMYVDLNANAAGGTAMVGWFTKADGSGECKIVRGSVNNYYVDGSNRGQLRDFMRTVLGDKFSATSDFYFACQSVAGSEEYLSSEISVIGTNGVRI